MNINKLVCDYKRAHPDMTDEQICQEMKEQRNEISLFEMRRIKVLRPKKAAPASMPEESFMEILQDAWDTANKSDVDYGLRAKALAILERYADFFEAR